MRLGGSSERRGTGVGEGEGREGVGEGAGRAHCSLPEGAELEGLESLGGRKGDPRYPGGTTTETWGLMEYGGKRGCVTETGPRFKPLEAPEARETTAPGGKQQQPSPAKLFTQLHVTSSRPEPLRTGREARGRKLTAATTLSQTHSGPPRQRSGTAPRSPGTRKPTLPTRPKSAPSTGAAPAPPIASHVPCPTTSRMCWRESSHGTVPRLLEHERRETARVSGDTVDVLERLVESHCL